MGIDLPNCLSVGAWRSLASALEWGSRGRRFKSARPDQPSLKLRLVNQPITGGKLTALCWLAG